MITRSKNLIRFVGSLIVALSMLVSAMPVASTVSANAMLMDNHELHMASDMDLSGHCEPDAARSQEESCCDGEPCDCVCLSNANSLFTGNNIETPLTRGPDFEVPDPTRLTDQFSSLLLPPPIINS